MAQTFDPALESNQDNPTLDTLTPSTHPPLILPEGTFPASAGNIPVLGFAPAPTGHAAPVSAAPVSAAPVFEDCQRPAAVPARLTHPMRRFRVGGYEAVIITLMLGCAALCLYRLLWAIQI